MWHTCNWKCHEQHYLPEVLVPSHAAWCQQQLTAMQMIVTVRMLALLFHAVLNHGGHRPSDRCHAANT